MKSEDARVSDQTPQSRSRDQQREDSLEMRHAVARADLHTNCAPTNTELFELVKNDHDPSFLRERCQGSTHKIETPC